MTIGRVALECVVYLVLFLPPVILNGGLRHTQWDIAEGYEIYKRNYPAFSFHIKVSEGQNVVPKYRYGHNSMD